eukprot:m.170693 g.170693  ORF g.170693 m.170693 type:complete len:77 (+) comp15276_c14_seq4:369-599(+)
MPLKSLHFEQKLFLFACLSFRSDSLRWTDQGEEGCFSSTLTFCLVFQRTLLPTAQGAEKKKLFCVFSILMRFTFSG